MFQVKKHKVDGVRRMAAHSHLPLCKFEIFFTFFNADIQEQYLCHQFLSISY